jgi:hypothetical protein
VITAREPRAADKKMLWSASGKHKKIIFDEGE